MILDLMLAYDQELRATYNFIQSLKRAYNQRDFTTSFNYLNSGQTVSAIIQSTVVKF